MCLDPASCPRSEPIALPEQGADFFAQMSVRLFSEGGLVSEEALQARLHRQGRCFDEVAGWLDEGRVRAIGWGRQRWLPTFQFTDGWALRTDVAAVAEELAGAMDDLEILAWFVCPNETLGRRTPLASLRSNYPDVLQAARLDHFLTSA